MAPFTITLSKTEIDNLDLSNLFKYVEWNNANFKYFDLEAGKEHYRLLSYFSKTLKCKKLIDIGTYLGFSAAALSYDSDKIVESYDIYDWFPVDDTITINNKDNINTYVRNYIDDLAEIIQDTDFILIDIDHSGQTEREIMDKLREIGYKGIVMLDDIGLNTEMKNFFDEIPEKKIDISAVGHWSKTGIVIFDPSRFEILLE